MCIRDRCKARGVEGSRTRFEVLIRLGSHMRPDLALTSANEDGPEQDKEGERAPPAASVPEPCPLKQKLFLYPAASQTALRWTRSPSSCHMTSRMQSSRSICALITFKFSTHLRTAVRKQLDDGKRADQIQAGKPMRANSDIWNHFSHHHLLRVLLRSGGNGLHHHE